MESTALSFWKRCVALGLAGMLAISLCPATALAADTADGTDANTPGAVTTPDQDAGQTTPDTPSTDAGESTPDTPGTETPDTPGTETPDTPGTDTPDTPGTDTPVTPPSTQDPEKPGTTTPAKPSKPTPAKPKKVTVSFITASKQGGKWQKASMGKLMGKKVATSPITAIRIYNKCKNISGSIKYRVYQANKGWSAWKANGKSAGTNKASTAVQGMQVKLTGDLAKKYNLYYRTYLVGKGWTGWGTNGAVVGAPKLAKVKAYQVKLVKRSDTKTNKKYNTKANRNSARMTTKSGTEMNTQMTMAAKAQSQSSATKWLILVDTTKNRVEILKGQKGDWKVHKYWKCTSGAWGTPTVRGKFTIGSRGLSFGEEKGYSCWYWTQFYGNYLFHSVLYNPHSQTSIQDGRLGINASHGCVRLALSNAKWINRNIPSGTKVWSY